MSDRTERLVTAFSCACEIGFALLDRELRYRALNASLANIKGMPEESHLGIAIGDIFGDLARRIAEPHYNRVLATGATAGFEVEDAALPNRPEAARYWGWNFNFPIRNHDGRITHIGVLVVEVTEQRKLQRLMRELEGKLRGSKVEAGFWFGRKIHDCLDQYDVVLKASFDVLVRNPVASLEQLVCSIGALEIAPLLPTDGPMPPNITLLSSTIRKHR
jgi:PAS domain-containing protein